MQPVSRATPVCSTDRSLTGPNGSRRGPAPSSPPAESAYAQVNWLNGWPDAVIASSALAGSQPQTRVCGSPQ